MRRTATILVLLVFGMFLFTGCASRTARAKYKYGIVIGHQYFPYPQYRNKSVQDAKFYGFLTKQRDIDYQARRAGELTGRVPIARFVRQVSYDHTKNTSCDNHTVLLDYGYYSGD
jgi:hypothetical protein